MKRDGEGGSGAECVLRGKGFILTIRLQGRWPEEVRSELTGATQRVAVLSYTEHSFPLQREVSDRPWMWKEEEEGENQNLKS